MHQRFTACALFTRSASTEASDTSERGFCALGAVTISGRPPASRNSAASARTFSSSASAAATFSSADFARAVSLSMRFCTFSPPAGFSSSPESSTGSSPAASSASGFSTSESDSSSSSVVGTSDLLPASALRLPLSAFRVPPSDKRAAASGRNSRIASASLVAFVSALCAPSLSLLAMSYPLK